MSICVRFLCLGTLGAVLAACVPPQQAAGPQGPLPDLIIVRPFDVPEGVVRLDPSFGFSLNRGSPGVPRQQRAASVGRAVAFQVAYALSDSLRAQGLAVERSESAGAGPGQRVVIVNGQFNSIDEGQRRRVHAVARGAGASDVAAQIWVDYVAPGQNVRLLIEQVDSSRIPGRGVADVNADSERIGRSIARRVLDLARQGRLFPAAGS